MIISKTTFFLLIGILLFSIFFANFAHQIDLDVSPRPNPKFDLENVNIKYRPRNLSALDDSPKRLMWFLQISDLHISIFQDESRITEMQDFCCRTVDAIKPSVVLASGDLTDAKKENNMGSRQFEGEWQSYARVLKTCNIKNKTHWLDIRGNHDNFNVPGWSSEVNYFRNYSMQGQRGSRSYMHVVTRGEQKFAFVAMDACLDLGPRRPFNFMGMISNSQVEQVHGFLKKVRDMEVDHTFWFGHYPTSCVLALGDYSLRSLIGDEPTSKTYMCGHLHQIGGLVKQMYTLQRQGFLELELGDWKDNRVFRLAAIDHDLFSFVDVKHGTWPITLITNPKHALYVMPSREPLGLIRESSHIRLLAFSLSPITSCQVKVDGGEWEKCEHVEGPLFVARWSPQQFTEGLHKVYAKVVDEQGRQSITEQPFSLDGTKMNFKIMAKIALMLDAPRVFQCMFGTMLLISILPLVILRSMHLRIISGKMTMPRVRRYFPFTWIRKLWMLSTVDHLFFPLMAYEIFMAFGPWTIGEILDGHMGAIFSWGIFVSGHFIPGSLTFGYGFIQMFMCQFPLTLIFADSVDKRYQLHWCGRLGKQSLLCRLLQQLPFITIISLQMVLAYFFLLAYGPLAFLLGPLRTWSIALNVYLWYKAITLPPEYTREAAKLWLPNKKVTSLGHGRPDNTS